MLSTTDGDSITSTFIDCLQRKKSFRFFAEAWSIQRPVETVPQGTQSRRAERVIIKEITV